MPVTRQDIEHLIETVADWLNDIALRCAKNPQGDVIIMDGVAQVEVTQWDPETDSWKFVSYRPWKVTKPEEIFVYIYCYDSKGETIEDLCYEEWYIEFLTETSICLRDTAKKLDDSNFELIPLSKIDRLWVGA